MFSKKYLILIIILLFISCDNSINSISSSEYENVTWKLIYESSKDSSYNSLNSLYFVDDNNGWVIGEGGKILHTDNGGESWDKQKSGIENSLIDIDFINRKVGWIISINRILKTTNAGKSWEIIYSSDTPNAFMSFNFVNEELGWVCDSEGNILYTSNSGNSWEYQNNLTDWGFTSIQFLNEQQGWALTTNNTILYTDNGGDNWCQLKIKPESDNSPVICEDIFFIDDEKGWASGTFVCSTKPGTVPQMPVYKTNNGGKDWIIQNELSTIWVTSIYFINSELGWISAKGKVFFTLNGGESWEVQFQDEGVIFNDVYFVDSNNGWLIDSNGNIYKFVKNKD